MRGHPFVLLVASLTLGPAQVVLGQSGQQIAITHVTVIDMTGAAPRANQTVVISGNRISSVGQAGPPAGATAIEGRGKFLIPGLWDMHVHTTVPGGGNSALDVRRQRSNRGPGHERQPQRRPGLAG